MRRSWSTERLWEAFQGDCCAITKGPEAGTGLACSWNKRSLVKAGNVTEDEVREIGKDQICGYFKGSDKLFEFYSTYNGKPLEEFGAHDLIGIFQGHIAGV